MYYLLSAVIIFYVFISQRSRNSELLSFVAILIAIIIAMFANILGDDFNNYVGVVQYVAEYNELPPGWSTTEILFLNIIRTLDSAHTLSIINGLLFMLALYIAPKLVRPLLANLVISQYLVISVFNGLRVGFAIGIFFVICMIFFRLKLQLSRIILSVISIISHTSLLFPIFIYFTASSKATKVILLYGILLLFFYLNPFDFTNYLLIKLDLYFEDGKSFVKYGNSVLFICNILMVIGWRRLLTSKQKSIYLIVIFISWYISFLSYFGIRILGLIPIAFYLQVMQIVIAKNIGNIMAGGITIPLYARLSFVGFALMNIKNMLLNDGGYYSFL